MVGISGSPSYQMCRSQLENLAKRRSFFFPAFEIYGGVAGLWDWGPPGCALKAELEALWRRHFILHEDMLEMGCSCLTPASVLKSSGHVDRFTDLMTSDTKTGECFRADKLLQEVAELATAAAVAPGESRGTGKPQKSALAVAPSGFSSKLDGPELEALQRLARLADSLSAAELETAFNTFRVVSPSSGAPLSAIYPFNLMFGTRIGPKSGSPVTSEVASAAPTQQTGPNDIDNASQGLLLDNLSLSNLKSSPQSGNTTSSTPTPTTGGTSPQLGTIAKAPPPKQQNVAYLRPETAQGIFVNFRRLLEYNGGRLPFAAAQLGLGFRNEIAPRNALLRVREFPMAEIEHFVDPEDKLHKRFDQVKHMRLPLFTKQMQQLQGAIFPSDPKAHPTLEEAVATKIVDNQTLAYYMARTYIFFLKCGIQPRGLRFRQHLDTEMAHYASDCWDAEIESSYGWIECAGIADRSAYDLTCHSKATGTSLVAMRRCCDGEARVETTVNVIPNKPLLGKTFKKDQAVILECLEKKSDAEKKAIEDILAKEGSYTLKICTGATYTLSREMIRFETTIIRVSEIPFVPNVVEPSFGIGRTIYCILEHTFRSRGIADQEERCFLALPPIVAPIKCSILPLSSNAVFEPFVHELRTLLARRGISCKVDISSATIGKRYARTDEIGIPFAITIDFQTAADNTVTLRERDSMGQIRLAASEAVQVVQDLVEERDTWTSVEMRYPALDR